MIFVGKIFFCCFKDPESHGGGASMTDLCWHCRPGATSSNKKMMIFIRMHINRLFMLVYRQHPVIRSYHHHIISSSRLWPSSVIIESSQQRLLHSNPLDKTDSSEPQITLTQRCTERLAKVLDSDEYLCVGVRGGGCSGFEYEFSVVNRSKYNPEEYLLFGDNVIVDRESIEYMAGSKLDYEDELIRSGFRITNNPLAEKGCSCGSSFSLKF